MSSGRWQIVQARPFRQAALTSELMLHGCSALHSPPLPGGPALGGPALCDYQVGPRPKPSPHGGCTERPEYLLPVYLHRRNLRSALELAMDIRKVGAQPEASIVKLHTGFWASTMWAVWPAGLCPCAAHTALWTPRRPHLRCILGVLLRCCGSVDRPVHQRLLYNDAYLIDN